MGKGSKEKSASTLSKDQKLKLYRNLVRANQFDLCFMRRIGAGELVGFFHAGQGGQAPGVGVCSFLREDDIFYPSVRSHGMGHMLGKGIDVKYFMAEHTGRTTGCCKGRSSYHAYFAEYGLLGITGFIGNNFPPTVGWGLACKKNGRGQVVMNCFGDGGSNRGTLHEAFLISSNWKLPIINVCENNGLAMFAPVTDCHPTENIADLAKGYGMPASIVDGQDVIACAEVALQAIEHARAGKGPYFIEAKTCRFESHCIGNPDLIGYAPRCLSEEEMSKLDPIRICRDRLIAEGVLTQELIEQIDADAAREVAEAEQFVADSPIANELDMQDVSKLVYAD